MFFLGRSKKAEKDGALAGELAEKNRRIDEEKNRLAAILESLVEGVVVVDTRQKINIANSAILRTLGCQKEKAEGRYYWEIFRDSDLNDMIRQALADEKPVAREHALLLSKKIFKIQVSPVRAGADFLGVAAIFHDITPLKELERARAEFVANVSHELKTPLTSILGSVETLKEGAAEDPVYRGKFLGIIENHSRELYRLIEDLLVLSKLESQKEGPAKEKIDFHDTVRRALDLFEGKLREKKIKVRFGIPMPFWIRADGAAFQQAVNNLIDNAVKYNRPGGEIFIEASHRASDDEIRIRDTGIGIAEGELEKIFERFYRVEKSRARDLGGTGLGLSIVKNIVENHGGAIRALPNEGGALFVMTLPTHE